MAASHGTRAWIASFALLACAALCGCATTAQTASASVPGHCMRLVGLDEHGRSVIAETGAGAVRYHLQQHGPEPEIETLTEAECRLHQICDAEGPKLEVFGLSPAERFQFASTPAPGEATVDVPGLGTRTLSFAPREDASGETAWTLRIDGEVPSVLHRAASTLDPEHVRWYRAGAYLWLELQTRSPEAACAAWAVNLDEAGAGALHQAALTALSAGRYDEAQALLERALPLDPDDETIAYNLACTFARKGDDAQALRWLEQAFQLDRDGRLRAEAMKDPDLERLRSNDAFVQLLAGG